MRKLKWREGYGPLFMTPLFSLSFYDVITQQEGPTMSIQESILTIGQQLTNLGQSILSKFTAVNKSISDNQTAMNTKVDGINTTLTTNIAAVQNAGLKIANNLSDLNDPVKARAALATSSTAEINQLISAAVNNLINGAPNALDTINELATALGNDPNFSQTIINQLATKADKSGVTMHFPVGPAATDGDAAQLIQVKNLIANALTTYVTQAALTTALNNYATNTALGTTTTTANKAATDAASALTQVATKLKTPTVSTVAPTATDGVDGDVWFQI